MKKINKRIKWVIGITIALFLLLAIKALIMI